MLGDRRLLAMVTGAYAVTRLALYWAGVRFSVAYDWQHIHDIGLLKDRLWETLLYTHSFTPFMSMLVGVVLKISERHSVAIYHWLYLALGWVFVTSMAYLMSALRFRRWVVVAVVTAFCCTPAFVYFENYLHYDYPTASLLALSAALLHRGLATGRWPWFLLFFADCALIAFVRTSFHLVWVLAAVGLATLFHRKGWRVVLATALAPVLSVVAFYAKNLVLFGFFGASSWAGFNLAIATVQRMGEAERRAWIDEGKIHPASGVRIYSGPRAYAGYVDLSRKTGVPVLDNLERQGALVNYNHWSYVEISKIRMADNRYYLAHRPREYVETVVNGVIDYFQPTTRWHPLDPQGSPHQDVRNVLEPWENRYNLAVHGGQLQPFGRYVPLIALVFYGTGAALRAAWRRRFEGCPEENVILFLAFCSFYVPALSCLVTIGELERYRFMVEAFLWVVGLWGLRRAFESLGWLKPFARASRPPGRAQGGGGGDTQGSPVRLAQRRNSSARSLRT